MVETGLAPVYRYYTADLLTNEILAEIPFRGVSYERAIKGAGGFSGSIPVIDATANLDIYESTMPGNTALYVVRNGVCVWGGVIWTRSYDVVGRVLQVTASEFTSYFYHRRMWKSWNHQYGATVTVADGEVEVLLDDGSASSSLKTGSSVKLQFDDAANTRYDGFYKISDTPIPTYSLFGLDNAQQITTVNVISRTDNVVTAVTDTVHGLSVNDTIDLDFGSGAGAEFSGTHVVLSVGGSEGTVFTYTLSGDDVAETEVSGALTRPIPDGVYPLTTVSVRADTYDYIRSMVDSVFDDFVGIDFPNEYIEPGISYNYEIIEREVGEGVATLKTAEPHDLAPGQAVQVKNVDPNFDGEFYVTETRAPDEFSYELGGTLATTTVVVNIQDIERVSATDGIVTVTTLDPHGFLVGQIADIETNVTEGGVGPMLNGTFEIIEIVSGTKFKYASGYTTTLPDIIFDPAIASSEVRRNLVYNPNFSSNISGWSAAGSTPATISQDSGESFVPDSSLKVVCDGSVSLQGAYVPTKIAVSGSTSYAYSAYVKGVVDKIVRLDLTEFSAPSFTSTIGTGADDRTNTVAVQSDGKIIVVGEFLNWNGASSSYIVRLNSDGTKDTTFSTNIGTAANGGIFTVALQSDGKILVGGQFTSWNGVTNNRIVRLNSDGTRDTTFTTNVGTAANAAAVYKFAIQSDGKIVVVGGFTSWNGTTVNRIVRLSSDGTRDTTFTTNAGTAANNNINAVALQSDGKIVVGGDFTSWNGTTLNRIVRLNSDGTRDTTFTTNVGTGPNLTVDEIYIQTNAEILVGGIFSTWNGSTANYLVRLSSSGVLDTSFSTNISTGPNGPVRSIVQQSDGKIVIGGQFTTWSGSAVGYIVRLNSDGTRDTAFTSSNGSGADGTVYALALQSDGKILVGGYITSWNSLSLGFLLRLSSTGVIEAPTTQTTTTGSPIAMTGEWQRLSIVKSMLSSTTSVEISIKNVGATAHTFYVDAVMFEKGIASSEYFDGNTVDTYGHTYSWSATANNSESIEVHNIDIILAEIADNEVTLTATEPPDFIDGNSVTLTGVYPQMSIIEKSLDAANSVATIQTASEHNLQVGDNIDIIGLRDYSSITARKVSGTTVTMYTNLSHNIFIGDSVDIIDLKDVYTLTSRKISGNTATLTTSAAHNISVGDEVTSTNIYDSFPVTNKVLTDNTITLTLDVPVGGGHNFQVNDTVAVAGIVDTANVISKTTENGLAVLTTDFAHNFLENDDIVITGLGAPFDGSFKVLTFTDTRITYEIEAELADQIPLTLASGTITSSRSAFNGDFVISARTDSTISYKKLGNSVLPTAVVGGIAAGNSNLNGAFTVSAVTAVNKYSFEITSNNMSETAIVPISEEDYDRARATVDSIHLGPRTITGITRNTFTFTQSGIDSDVPLENVTGTVTVDSIFNGTDIDITAKTADTFSYTLEAPSNVLETPANSLAYVSAPYIYNGTFTLTEVNPDLNTIKYAKSHVDMPATTIQGYGSATVNPVAIVSTFGPFPGNSDIGIGFSTKAYSGKQVDPISYRGFELVNVGEALSKYSDSIDGFEYRIDCAYDASIDKFVKTFILIPIDFPNPPSAGEVSPISRFGADKLVFEYPGNIINLSIEESAENSSTRFFAVGENDLGPDAGPPFSVASANGFLRGVESKRKWPILDDDEKVPDVDDETVLYSYAERYLSEARPPDAKLSLSVNGSLQPVVGSYAPGDWCSLIVDDAFILERLRSDMEPRDTVIVRKIDVIKVSVPDGTTFPEKVDLTLVPEWEVDKRG